MIHASAQFDVSANVKHKGSIKSMELRENRKELVCVKNMTTIIYGKTSLTHQVPAKKLGNILIKTEFSN